MEPQDEVARDFMQRKGYQSIEPFEVDKVEGIPCWYFMYELPEGTLELEVSFNGHDWETYVSTFTIAG